MKPIIFSTLLFLAASSGLAYPGVPTKISLPRGLSLPPTEAPSSYEPPTETPSAVDPLTKGLPPPPPDTQTKGLPPPDPLTKGLPPPPPDTQTKGLPPPDTQTKGLPPPGARPQSFIDALPSAELDALSPTCLATLFAVATDPEIQKCIPLTALVNLIPLATDPTIIKNFLADPAKNYPPLEKPLVAFSEGICAAPKCSDAGIAKAVKTIQSGCKDNIKEPIIQAVLTTAAIYSPARDSICFKDKQGTFCWDETLLTVVKLPKSPIKIVDGGIIDSVAVADPQQVCTPCNRAMINTFGNYLKDHPDVGKVLGSLGIDVNVAKVGIAVKCGIKFEDGNVGDPGK